MDEAVEPVIPLTVHKVALTSINIASPDEAPVLFPAVGVWADLDPVHRGGVTRQRDASGALPVLVITDSVVDACNPALMTIVLAHARYDDSEPDEYGHGVSPFGPHWSMQVPTTWVAMATVVMGTPLQMRIVLLDGCAPSYPESYVVTLDEAKVVVLPAAGAVHHSLRQVMSDEWTAPAPMQSGNPGGEVQPPVLNLMRDMLWSSISGVALGQVRAFNRAVDYAALVGRLDGGDEGEQEQFAAAMLAADWVAESSQLQLLTRDAAGRVVWPEAMGRLVEHIDAAVDTACLDALDRGAVVEDVAEAFGVTNMVLALCVLVAARANSSAASVPPDDVEVGRYTPVYLVGMWLDAETDTPWWAARAAHHLLINHDTEVLVNLLVCNPMQRDLSDGHGPLSYRFLHVVAEALASLDMAPAEFGVAFRQLDLTPPGFEDVLHVCERLLEGCVLHAEADECVGCLAVHDLISETVDQGRLVRAAVGALPLIADFEANVEGLSVGEKDWRSHREGFLMHWLNHTAIVPDPS